MDTRDEDEKKEPKTEGSVAEEALPEPQGSAPLVAAPQAGPEPTGETVPTQFGTQRYVHAAFFAGAILLAFLAGKLLAAAWNSLADWPAAVRAVPQLVTYAEEERDSLALAAGALIAIATVIQIYRRERIRRWADEVAAELSKVTWPNRETVVNGTVVVVIATTFATAYVAVLDRFWGFLTNLVYGT